MTIPVPTTMRDRWRDRAEKPVGSGTVYWHVLMRDHPAVVEAANEAQNRLVDFPGLHRTPREWFHMTVYVASATEEIRSDSLGALLARSQEAVKGIHPVPVTARRVLCHCATDRPSPTGHRRSARSARPGSRRSSPTGRRA